MNLKWDNITVNIGGKIIEGFTQVRFEQKNNFKLADIVFGQRKLLAYIVHNYGELVSGNQSYTYKIKYINIKPKKRVS